MTYSRPGGRVLVRGRWGRTTREVDALGFTLGGGRGGLRGLAQGWEGGEMRRASKSCCWEEGPPLLVEEEGFDDLEANWLLYCWCIFLLEGFGGGRRLADVFAVDVERFRRGGVVAGWLLLLDLSLSESDSSSSSST